MVKLAYAAAATCKLSGVHNINPADGRCVTCGETIFIPVAYEAVSTAKKKGGPRKALPPASRPSGTSGPDPSST